jgi:hypothetical protein
MALKVCMMYLLYVVHFAVYKDLLITAFLHLLYSGCKFKTTGNISTGDGSWTKFACLPPARASGGPQPEPEAVSGQLAENSAAKLKRGSLNR